MGQVLLKQFASEKPIEPRVKTFEVGGAPDISLEDEIAALLKGVVA
jgi:hypothetical protein